MLDRRRFLTACGTFALASGGCGSGDGTWSEAGLDKLRAIASALLRYRADGHAGPEDIVGRDGTPLWSWRVRLLPYLKMRSAYGLLRLDEPWDSPHNARWTDRSVDEFRWGSDPVNTTRFLAVRYAGTTFPDTGPVRDRESNERRLLLAAVGPEFPVPWGSPGDLDLSEEQREASYCKLPERGVSLAFADGHATRLPQRPSLEELLVLVDADGDGIR